MKRRLYFMLPDIRTARQVRKELLLARIEDRNIHCLVKPGTPVGNLPQASLFERTDFLHEGETGILIGAAWGLLAGLLALAFPSEYFPMWYTSLHWSGILAITTFIGACSGGIGMALLGMNLPNSDLDAFRARIMEGEVLMMVAVPFSRLRGICRIMKRLHPEVVYAGAWPSEHAVFP